MHRYTEEFARHGIVAGQVLLTVDDVTRRAHYRNAYQTFAKLLELGVRADRQRERHRGHRPRSGSATTTGSPRWSPTWSHADLLVLLSDVDGLYDGHPADGRQPR